MGQTPRIADVLAICDEALEREGADREAYLDAACGTDVELRREAEAVLARQEHSSKFFETPPWPAPAPAPFVGQRLGPYEVTAEAGAGGMGRVYRARDTRIGRTVALKTIAGARAFDDRARERLIQEAQTIASLNHPHVCALYDVGREGDIDFLVMEYVEGETLSDRLIRGPLLLELALEYGAQLAEALSCAHRKGVVHRDLKPGNVMLTKSGVKLLDFGLARLTQPSSLAIGGKAPRLESTIAGTLPYMAPEELKGLPTDTRADVFALGCVLYEMATGTRAFDGERATDVTAAVLERDPPPVSSTQPLAPAALDRLVGRCLAKDPDERWQSAADLATELRWLAAPSAEAPRAPSGRRRVSKGRGLLLMAAAVAALALVGIGSLLVVPWHSAKPPSVPYRFSIVAADLGLAFTDGGIAISPDGKTLVYVASADGTSRLHRRQLDEWTAKPIEGTEGASAPFFSPDGQWIGYSPPGGGFMKVPVAGGPRQTIWAADKVERRLIAGATWGPDGIVFGRFFADTGLWTVPAEGGTPRPLIRPGKSAVWYMWPEVLPGGRTVLFTIWQRGRTRIAALSLETRTVKTLVASGTRARYLPGGYLVYESGSDLLAAPFDADAVAIKGTARAVVPVVGKSIWAGSVRLSLVGRAFDLSQTGTLVYAPPADVLSRLVWKDRHGRTTPLPLPASRYSMPALSPDGSMVADTITDGYARNLWIGSVKGRTMMRLTPGEDDCYSLFTPDGKWVVYLSNQDDDYKLCRIRSDKSSPPELMTADPSVGRATSWSPDGEVLLVTQTDETGDGSIFALERGKLTPAVKTPMVERAGVFSPDGKWIAYQSNESGRMEIYVARYPAGARFRVSLDGGAGPVWNPRGGELFFQGRAAVMAVRIVDGRQAGVPVALFSHAREFRDWDVAPDGQRFLVVEGGDASTSPPRINVVVNWLDELATKLRTGQPPLSGPLP